MATKHKKRRRKSVFGGLWSFFSPSNNHNDESVSSTAANSPLDISTAGTTTQASGLEHSSPSLFDGCSLTASRANTNSSTVEHTAVVSMFSNAQRFHVENINIHSPPDARSNRLDGWKMLLENIAPNALHDSRARFDPPKCDEDTRVEVIKELMDWLQDRNAPTRLLCMTGAAGAGKSALQQTVAERCSESDILGSAFFFSAGDSTRNSLTRIVPTIACQLGLHNFCLQDAIVKAIEKDPLIFDKKLNIQMNSLVVRPFKRVCATGGLDPITFPHVILIDGLDECSGEANQAELLSAIEHCFLDNDLPFRIFVASRPEWAIRNALESAPEGYLYPLAYQIKLSDKYDATDDIRRFLWRRLRDIGSRSRDRRAQSPLWPTKDDIEKLVAAASGQFVHAATVVKYVSERRGSPVDRLRTIVNWSPEGGQQTRPFEILDDLYRNILSAAKELYEAVDTNRGRDFFLLLRAHHINSGCSVTKIGLSYSTTEFDAILGLEEGSYEIVLSDLHSLVFFRQEPTVASNFHRIYFYHRSFSEFMDSEIRAQDLFVSEQRVREYVTGCCLQKLQTGHTEFLDFEKFSRTLAVLSYYADTRASHVHTPLLKSFTTNNGWGRIDERLSSQTQRELLNLYGWGDLARFTFDVICHFNDGHEHELEDLVRQYFDKWQNQYQPRGENFSARSVSKEG